MRGEHLSFWLTVKYELMETIGKFILIAAMAISTSVRLQEIALLLALGGHGHVTNTMMNNLTMFFQLHF